MSDEASAVLALKNAWSGAVAASREIEQLADEVAALPEGSALTDLDLDRYHRLTAAQSNAVMALRGLVEQLQRKREKAAAG